MGLFEFISFSKLPQCFVERVGEDENLIANSDVHNITPIITENPKPKFQKRALDLFSGTGSVGQRLKEWGYEVISVDINPNAGADICTDVLRWSVQKIFPPRLF